MLIENPESLKNWLTIVLEPLCDADPSALARYVLALLKKNKPQEELSSCMAEQLDVFLGSETVSFLEKLFNVIKTQAYVKSEGAETTVAVEAMATTTKEEVPREATPPLKENIAEEPAEKKTSPPPKAPLTPNNKSKSQEPISVSRSQEAVRDNRRRRNSNRSRSRSRSRSKSFDRQRRSRSRDRHMREKNLRQFRNSSPPPNINRSRNRKNDRMSPKIYSTNRQPRHRSKSMSRSRSNSPVEFRRTGSPTMMKMDTNDRKRCRDFDEKGYCMRGETCPWDHGVDPVVLEDINNPSLLGIQHAVGSVGMRAPIHSEYNPDAPDLWNRGPNFGPVPGMPGMHGRQVLPVPAPRQQNFAFRGPFPFPPGSGGPQLPRELIPVPVMDASGQPTNPLEMGQQIKRRYDQEDPSVQMMEGPAKRKLSARLGPRIGAMQQQSQQSMQQNCSLELRKIPRGLNAISHLNNHFSKFGKIVNIQVSYDNDPEAAIVTFSSHAEANVAYRSTEAVLNNRFIKVFWHTPTGEPPKGPELPAPGSMSLRRTYTNPNAYPSASQAQGDSGTVTTTTTTSSVAGNSSTNPDSTTSITTTQAPTQPTQKSTTYISPATATAREQTKASNQLIMKQVRATNELIRKKQEEQTKTAVQLAHGLQEKKHELLQKYLKQMRSIVELAEKTESDAQRHQYMDTIKILQASIDKLRKEINEQVNIQSKINPHAKARKTKEQQQKELLDVELDLISKEQHGETDTAAIQKRLQELQKSLARAQSYFPTAPRPPRPVRVIAPPGSTSVDRRPTTILITGFLLEDSDAVLGHFKHYGEITKNVLEKTVPSLTLSYSNRANAEQAIVRGKLFKEKLLNTSWHTPASVAEPTVISQKSETDSEKGDDQNNDLLEKSLKSDDPESDDDPEVERSWRR